MKDNIVDFSIDDLEDIIKYHEDIVDICEDIKDKAKECGEIYEDSNSGAHKEAMVELFDRVVDQTESYRDATEEAIETLKKAKDLTIDVLEPLNDSRNIYINLDEYKDLKREMINLLHLKSNDNYNDIFKERQITKQRIEEKRRSLTHQIGMIEDTIQDRHSHSDKEVERLKKRRKEEELRKLNNNEDKVIQNQERLSQKLEFNELINLLNKIEDTLEEYKDEVNQLDFDNAEDYFSEIEEFDIKEVVLDTIKNNTTPQQFYKKMDQILAKQQKRQEIIKQNILKLTGMPEEVYNEAKNYYKYLKNQEHLSGNELDRVFWGTIAYQRYGSEGNHEDLWDNARGELNDKYLKKFEEYKKLSNWTKEPSPEDCIDLSHMAASLSVNAKQDEDKIEYDNKNRPLKSKFISKESDVLTDSVLKHGSGRLGDIGSEFVKSGADYNIQNPGGNYNEQDKATDQLTLELEKRGKEDSSVEAFIKLNEEGIEYEQLLSNSLGGK